MELEARVPGEHLEVSVRGQDGHALADGDGGDEAVDQLPNGLASATAGPVERSRRLVVGRSGRQRGRSRQEPTELLTVCVEGACQEARFDPGPGIDVTFLRPQRWTTATL